ncbi:MAG: hypothetical protein PHG05_04025 [Candidatus Nanoarchaeia archaeon]|nr:hypothetical protein [Candidatus Nanoarchaeia archaeon]
MKIEEFYESGQCNFCRSHVPSGKILCLIQHGDGAECDGENCILIKKDKKLDTIISLLKPGESSE